MHKHFLVPASIYVDDEPAIISTILGSCVAVAVYDRVRMHGGMNHFLLPRTEGNVPTARYGDAAMHKLIRLLLELGSRPAELEAILFGGAYTNASSDSMRIAAANIEVAGEILERYSVPIRRRYIGATTGRKVSFFTHTGEHTLKLLTPSERIGAADG